MSDASYQASAAYRGDRVRAERSVQRFAREALIAAVAAASAAAARIVIEHFVGGVAPFILTFPAVMAATLVGGGRAGAIAALSCQMLTIRYVFPNWVSTHGGISTSFANVALSTVALAGTVWATTAYRRASVMLRSQCEHHVKTLSLLLKEMEHRTKNNFQIAAGLLAHQSLSSLQPGLAGELEKAASRLESIASIYQDMSVQIATGKPIELSTHIERIVTLLSAGATPEHVSLNYRADHALVSNEVAVVAGLLVNEWVTNSLKHAFGSSSGSIWIDVCQSAGLLVVTVSDDGEARAGDAPPVGHGSDLMMSLAEAVGASIDTSYRHGTRCTFTLSMDRGS